MGQARNWTSEELLYLSDSWGNKSLKTICEKLDRTENAIHVKVQRMGLGPFLDSGEYITWNQLLKAVGSTGGSGYKIKSWVENRGFPLKKKKVNNCSCKVVYLDDFWKWAENHKDFLDFSKFEENILGLEPEWVKDKRKHDIIRNRKYITTPWTKSEDSQLIYLLQQYKYTYDDLSKMLRRTNGAIQRRVCDLGIKERPIKAYNHTKWTDNDYKLLGDLIKSGYGYDLIAEKIGKSSKAIRGRVYAMYLTENLDKARGYIGEGCFGNNRPERKLTQLNVMNTEERKETRDLISRFAGICRYVYRQSFDESDFWQKDICMHWDDYCTMNETDCDSCTSFERIKPQYCKRCGATFYEREEHLYCQRCREQRKKQRLR